MKRLNLIKNQLSSLSNNNNNTLKQNKCINKYTEQPSFNLIVIKPSLKNEKVKILQINSPKNLNALTNELIEELDKAYDYLSYDKNTKVIIITGCGKSFISGADISNLNKETYNTRVTQYNSLNKVIGLFYKMNKPVIAAINGYCFGGGLEMAMNCDIILASDKAVIGLPEIKLGLIPGAGGTQKLVKVFGYNKATEYIMTGKNISLDDAVRGGLINQVIKHDELLEKADAMANSIAQYGIISLINAKRAMKMALEVGLERGLEVEKQFFDPLFDTQDKVIGTTAFLKKQKPKFVDA